MTTHDTPADDPVGEFLAALGTLSEEQARALADRWPLVEAPDGDVILIAVPGRVAGPEARDRIARTHAAAGQAVADRAVELGHDERDLPRYWLCALAEAQTVAVALEVRPRGASDDDTAMNWYLAMTEVWRQEIGRVHPDDPEPLGACPWD